MYCVYLTTYSGNKLPPFYIGYTTIRNIERGYRGSVSSKLWKDIWKQELLAHPELFKTQVICTSEDHKSIQAKEAKLQRSLNVIHNPLYVNRSMWPIISTKGYKFTEEHKRKLSEQRRGKKMSEEGRKKIAEAQRRPETRAKMSAALKGRKKTPEHVAKVAAAGVGRVWSEESRMKMSQSKRGKKQSPEVKEKIRQALLGKKRGSYKKKSVL